MAKLNCPKCPDFDGFAMCTSQPLSKVASYEWCRKYLEGLEEVNGTITLSTDLFLRLLRKAYSDAYYGAIHMEFMRDIKDVEYPLEIHIDDTPKLEKLGLLGGDLSGFVNGQREEYYKLEEACMETVRQQNSMLDSFPNVMYNKVLGIQKLQYNPGFTSTHTEHVFKTKKEDI